MERVDRILVVRLDPRVGNLVLLTPLLSSLRLRFPKASIQVVVHAANAILLTDHPAIDRLLLFDKKKFMGKNGVLAIWAAIRSTGFDLALDAANPTFPSTTQALIVRFSNARYTTGVSMWGLNNLYTHPVEILEQEHTHEISLRLGLLQALPGTAQTETISLGQEILRTTSSVLNQVPQTFALLNLGARLVEKQLSAKAYARIGNLVLDSGMPLILSYGPSELKLARATQQLIPKAQLAPPTNLPELAQLMAQAKFIVSCDTGPMHIATATGSPTLGIFVSTPPKRYGYTQHPHAVVDARAGFNEPCFQAVREFVLAQEC